jgi:acetyltransferase-like isoleucine patch superfamily enzyme
VNLATRIFRRIAQLPARIQEKIEEDRKKEECATAAGVRFHPESRVWNFQKKAEAILIGKESHIRGELIVFGHGGSIQIGETCYVGEGSRIWSAASITIGDRVLISHGVNIHDNNSHSLSAVSRSSHFKQIISSGHSLVLDDVSAAPIVIQDDAWVGFNSTILKGVTIGRGAVVAAASVVTKDVPAFSIVGGCPAKVIGVASP